MKNSDSPSFNPLEREAQMAKIMAHLKTQNFSSNDEMKQYLNTLIGKTPNEINALDKVAGIEDTNEAKARNLVIQASKIADVDEGRKQIAKALKLDPDNADAYLFLAETSGSADTYTLYVKEALEAGKRKIGDDFEAMRGSFWGIQTTRPFMRAKESYAQIFFLTGKIEEAISEYQDMLSLNPDDNQGIRHTVIFHLLQAGQLGEYRKLRKEYKHDVSTFFTFSYALYKFLQTGNSSSSRKAIQKAFDQNQYLREYFSGDKEAPEDLPEYFGFNDDNEAQLIYAASLPVISENRKLVSWLKNNAKKS